MNTPSREREKRYTSPVTVRLRSDIKERLDVLADREAAVLGIVLRRVIEAGLPEIEGLRPEKAGRGARLWWSGLDKQTRSRWGKRLGHINGPAFLDEAYRLAMEEED